MEEMAISLGFEKDNYYSASDKMFGPCVNSGELPLPHLFNFEKRGTN